MSIKYKQMEKVTSEFPADVEMIVDEENDMTEIRHMVGECGFEIELPEEKGTDGKYHTILPGSVVGEFADCMYEIDGGELESVTEQWNEEALNAAETNDED